MTTIALIGVDGAGKTTIANKLLTASFPRPLKYVYMGLNIESSNYKLPTSRLILYMKLRAIHRKAVKAGNTDPSYLTTHHVAHRKPKRGKVWTIFRDLNRFGEAWYRLAVSWVLQLRGYIVLYDRHLLFDLAPDAKNEHNRELTERALFWMLTRYFPEPDLVVFLEAAPEILYARKEEAPVDYLARKMESISIQGAKMKNFVQVDAGQSLDQVYTDVHRHIENLCESA